MMTKLLLSGLMMLTLSTTLAWAGPKSVIRSYAQTELSLRAGGIAHLGGGNVLAIGTGGAAVVVNSAGDIIQRHALGASFNRPPVSFPSGGAMAVSIARTMFEQTQFFFFNEAGDLIKKSSAPGFSPGILKLEADGTIQANPMGKALFFNSQGEVARQIDFAPETVFFTPMFNFRGAGYFAATGVADGYRITQFDSFFDAARGFVHTVDRGVPTFPPAMMNNDIVIVPRWDGEVYAANAQGDYLGSTFAEEFIIEAAVTLDGDHAWVATLSHTGILKVENNNLVIAALFPLGLSAMTPVDTNTLLANDWHQMVLVDQSKVLAGEDALLKTFALDLAPNDRLAGTIVQVGPEEYVSHTLGGHLFRVNVKK